MPQVLSLSSASSQCDSTFRAQRLRHRLCDIGKQLDRVLATLSGVVPLGDDPLARFCVSKWGVPARDVVIRQFLADGEPATIICVPGKLWFKASRLSRIRGSEQQLRQYGRQCLIIPQFALPELEERAACDSARIEPDSKIRVLDILAGWQMCQPDETPRNSRLRP